MAPSKPVKSTRVERRLDRIGFAVTFGKVGIIDPKRVLAQQRRIRWAERIT